MDEEIQVYDDLEAMRKRLEAEREKYGYSIDDPVEPIADKSGVGRMIFSILFIALIVALGIVVVSLLALQNAGQPFELPFIKSINLF